MKVRIEIDTKTFVRFWLVVMGFGLAGLAIYSAKDALILLGISLFLALALNRPVAAIAKKLPGKSRLGGTALAYTTLVLLLGCVAWFVVPPIVQQSAKFVESVPSLIDQTGSQWHGFNELIDKNGLRPQVDATLNNLRQQASSWAASAGTSLISSVGSLAAFLGSLFLVLVLSFLMLLEGPMWMKRLWGLYNDQEKMERHKKLVGRMYNVVTGYVSGQLTVSGIDAILSGFVVFVLSLAFPAIDSNLAMLTVMVTFVLTLIPMFGATLAGLLISLLLFFNNVTAGVIYAIYFIVYQQIENNFIAPSIQSKKLELSALMVLSSVTIGLYVGGLLGSLIAIPTAGVVRVLLENYLEQARLNRIESEKPLNKLMKKLKNES
ncbi:AI-2E family transporter [Candidatus Nanosynbacter sp. TM7-074]|uniref:AI-2E family transporter n=1 Tax=Candidatus Nanosynbacter sp. TM7-074 TaxID=3158573 RepID=A0AB39JBP0_9BACT